MAAGDWRRDVLSSKRKGFRVHWRSPCPVLGIGNRLIIARFSGQSSAGRKKKDVERFVESVRQLR
jgi:hypothetical protein